MKPFCPMMAFAMLVASPAIAADAAKKTDAPKMMAAAMNAADLKWVDPPPEIPKGAQLAVLQGDPSKKGSFAIRLKMPAGYRIPPHWHTNDEQLTILQGIFVLHMGDTMDAPGATLTAGGFHSLPGKMHHAAETKGETIVQINGMGPFDIHYLNPADNPAKSAAVKQ
jgi:anti-sigma factor ChrR (cupin superfamily)